MVGRIHKATEGQLHATPAEVPTISRRRPAHTDLPSRLHKKALGDAPGTKLSALPKMIATHELRLRSEAGEVRIPADNYFLAADGSLRPEMADIAKVIFRRSPEAQLTLNAAITEAHAAHEMSFRVKDPETGNYDKIFKVPSYGTVVPLREAHFQKLVASTEPVMRALRAMLQTIYSKPNLTAADLGIAHLPKAEQERMLESITRSVYFEPKLVDPAMKDYPFLSVAGFDASVGNLDNPSPTFFEYNLGTPSGMSNNRQLVEILRTTDPELYATFEKRLPKDETFSILRKAIESNALAWTNKAEGITVVLSPGSGNGAHPDVASIAMFSGLPLVNPSDLYEDKNGEIRLNRGEGQAHPIVSGIYGRMEESFFLMDERDGVPIRSPDYEDNPAIGERLGVRLEAGVIYELVHDEKGLVVDVKLDAAGNPRYQPAFETIGRDPSRPDEPRGSFLRAIKGKQLYYSGLGGRVVDDKRVFQTVADHLAKAYARSAEAPIARPPRTLDPSEYDEFYKSKNLENFVVKEPDKSGGSGVMLLCNLPAAQRLEVIEAVKRDPMRHIVQEFAQPAVMTSVERDEKGEAIYGSLANDWRIFSIMDADGNVSAGPSSLLLRAAKPFSASTNTSQGAGYGIGLVLADEPVKKRDTSLPPFKPSPWVSVGKKADLAQFVGQLDQLLDWSKPGSILMRGGNATLLATFQRDVMDLLGRDFAPLMTIARSYDEGAIDQPQLYAQLLGYRTKLLQARGLAKDVTAMLREGLASPNLLNEPRRGRPAQSDRIRERAPIAKLATPILVRVDGDLEKREIGRYHDVPDPFFTAAIAELEAAGGEIRRIELTGKSEQIASAYFRVDEDGRPIIGLDVGQNRALAGLAHELAHFALWKKERDALIAGGMSPKAAAKEAMERLNTPEMRVIGERLALKAELEAEGIRSPFNAGSPGPRNVLDQGFIARILYPELEGVRDRLHRVRWNGHVEDAELPKMFDDLVKKAGALRLEAHQRRKKTSELLLKSPRPGDQQNGHQELAKSMAEIARPLFGQVVDAGAEQRFKADDTWLLVQQHFASALDRAGLDARQKVALQQAIQGQQ